MWSNIYLSLAILLLAVDSDQFNDGVRFQPFPKPYIEEVTAMCTSEGITAQITFNDKFYGKLYSKNYPTTHECVYYNNFDMSMILFSIPNYKCGTRVKKNNENVVATIENEVYVQFDKDTQNIDDKRYLFICEMGKFSIDKNTITVRPDQTIVVQTISPTSVPVRPPFNDIKPSIRMEIQDGIGPGKPLVRRILQLGETITLVITGNNQGRPFDMFVHSCHATDGAGINKADFVDRLGCTTRPQIADKLVKSTRSSDVVYSVHIKSFKFPSSEDVYFTCSVDLCDSCRFPEPCIATKTLSSNFGDGLLRKRSLNGSELIGTSLIRSDDDLKVVDSIRIADNSIAEPLKLDAPEETCLKTSSLIGLFSVFTIISLMLSSVIFYLIIMQRRNRNKITKTVTIEKSTDLAIRKINAKIPLPANCEDLDENYDSTYNTVTVIN